MKFHPAFIAANAALCLLAGCGKNPNDKILGQWIDMRSNRPVEFTDKEMKTPAGVQMVDHYAVDGDKITVFLADNPSAGSIVYNLSEDGKKACTGPELYTCIVRPDRLGKLTGTWGNDASNPRNPSNVTFTAARESFGGGGYNFPIEHVKIDGDTVVLNMYENRELTQEPATRSMPPATFTIKSDDVICLQIKPTGSGTAPPPRCMARIKANAS